MTKTVEPKYTTTQVAELEAAAAQGPITPELAEAFANRWGKKPRAVVAKIVSMKLPYAKKVRAKKNIEAGATKADLVATIAAVIPGNLAGLENAPRTALEALVGFIEA